MMPSSRPPLPYIEQAISCLHSYRDDAHLAAWQKTGLSATALETLTLLWRGLADSLEAICQQLARRGYTSPGLQPCPGRPARGGFVDGPDSAPHVSPSGRAFRENVEQETNLNFFACWAILSEAQRQEMGGLLILLRDGLNGKVSIET